mmetsp:Transcript_15865/g.34409  ORF Transcript_15865/g.34409 Transcript_15865/m.34409 type:complete len:241 (-) Transcript_15865:1071-1793(-)
MRGQGASLQRSFGSGHMATRASTSRQLKPRFPTQAPGSLRREMCSYAAARRRCRAAAPRVCYVCTAGAARLLKELRHRHLEAAAVQRLHAHVHDVVHQHLCKVVDLLHAQPLEGVDEEAQPEHLEPLEGGLGLPGVGHLALLVEEVQLLHLHGGHREAPLVQRGQAHRVQVVLRHLREVQHRLHPELLKLQHKVFAADEGEPAGGGEVEDVLPPEGRHRRLCELLLRRPLLHGARHRVAL